jgi:hypothetical protein
MNANPEGTLEENSAKVLLTGQTADDIFQHKRTQVDINESSRFRLSESSQ